MTPRTIIAIVVIFTSIVWLSAYATHQSSSSSSGVSHIRINAGHRISELEWAQQLQQENQDIAGTIHLTSLTHSTPRLTLPDHTTMTLETISNGYIHRSIKDATRIQALKLQEVVQSKSQCIERMLKIAGDLRMPVEVNDLQEWDKQAARNNSLSRANYTKRFDDLGITFEVAILPVPSVNQRWVVMVSVWWHDSFILDL